MISCGVVQDVTAWGGLVWRRGFEREWAVWAVWAKRGNVWVCVGRCGVVCGVCVCGGV